jgi:hypothetical protein
LERYRRLLGYTTDGQAIAAIEQLIRETRNRLDRLKTREIALRSWTRLAFLRGKRQEEPSSPQTGACGVVYVLDRRFQVGVEGEEKQKKAFVGLFFIGLQSGAAKPV